MSGNSVKVVSFTDQPVKRFDDVRFGYVPNVIDYKLNSHSFVFAAKVVDDSSYTPNSNYIRAVIANHKGSVQDGVYDFNDGVDNGFNPSFRSLSLDIAEIDSAAKSVLDSAKSKAEAEKAKKSKAASDERNEKILNNLASLGVSNSSTSSSDSSPSE